MTGTLTRSDIREYLARPMDKALFVSPILEEDQVGATSIDLRLGHRFLVPDRPRLGSLDAFSQSLEDVAAPRKDYREVRIQYGRGFYLHPGQTVLAGTLEYLGMPSDLEGYVTSRSSVSRLPILMNPAAIHPGFRGVVTLTLTSMAAAPITLRPGERVAQLQLHTLSAPVLSHVASRYDMATGPAPAERKKNSDDRYLGPSVEPIVLGIVSTLGAGRSTAREYLFDRHGFIVFMLAETIKLEAIKSGLSTTRARLQQIGTDLRRSHGNGHLAERLRASLAWLSSKGPYVVVDGFKHRGEVHEFKKQKHFSLLGIDAPLEERWRRVSILRREGDPTTFEEFVRLDAIDRGLDSAQAASQEVDQLLEMADFRINNDGTVQDFYNSLEGVIRRILGLD